MHTLSLYYRYDASQSSYPHAVSHALLIRSVSLHTGEATDAFVVERTKEGKPYLKSHPSLHVSISHSGALWACLIADAPIGLDVQERKSGVPYERLRNRWFHPAEAATVRCEADFYRVWCRKEAFVKALGIGIEGHFKSFASTKSPCTLEKDTLFLHSFDLPDGLCTTYEAAAALTYDFTPSAIQIAKL